MVNALSTALPFSASNPVDLKAKRRCRVPRYHSNRTTPPPVTVAGVVAAAAAVAASIC